MGNLRGGRAAVDRCGRLCHTSSKGVSTAMCIRKAGAGQVTVSPGYRVVIPKEVRKALSVRPGQKFEVIAKDGIIRLVPFTVPGQR